MLALAHERSLGIAGNKPAEITPWGVVARNGGRFELGGVLNDQSSQSAETYQDHSCIWPWNPWKTPLLNRLAPIHNCGDNQSSGAIFSSQIILIHEIFSLSAFSRSNLHKFRSRQKHHFDLKNLHSQFFPMNRKRLISKSFDRVVRKNSVQKQ